MCLKRRVKNELNSNITTFKIPAGNLLITDRDIKKGQIRITGDNKKYFPDYDCDVKITINNKSFLVKFRLGNNIDKTRSHLLNIGHDAIDLLQFKSGEHLIVKRIDERTYNIEKA